MNGGLEKYSGPFASELPVRCGRNQLLVLPVEFQQLPVVLSRTTAHCTVSNLLGSGSGTAKAQFINQLSAAQLSPIRTQSLKKERARAWAWAPAWAWGIESIATVTVTVTEVD